MKSLAIAMLLVLCACGGHDRDGACIFMGTPHAIGDVYPVGDGCNSCTCTETGSVCTNVMCSDAGVDANPMSCAASGGCPEGPACGMLCCKHGERCTNGTCQCGTGPACGSGDTCERSGPVGGDVCGTLCCGDSGRCPL